MIDFHTHSNASDGVLSPSELMATAAAKGIKYIALTDHNNVNGLQEAAIVSEKYGIELVNGAEFSCERNTHITGLFLKRFDEIKRKGLLRKEYIEYSLAQYGFTVAKYGTSKDARDAFIAHSIETGKAKNKTFAIEHFLQPPFGYGEAIDLIHRAGGLAILAHPNRISGINTEMLPDFVKELVKYGIDGVEVFQSAQTDEYTDFIKNLAIKYNLLFSGGSDYHGSPHHERELGCYGNVDNRKPVPEEVFENLWKNKDKYR